MAFIECNISGDQLHQFGSLSWAAPRAADVNATTKRHQHEVRSIFQRNNVKVSGQGQQPIVFLHGYGCDQNMWRAVAPRFEDEYKVVLLDHVGHGQSDGEAFDPQRYSSLDAYADDVLEICRELKLENVILVGHSVGAMIGALAALREPNLFDRLVLVSPSPCYLNHDGYRGGFEKEEIDGLLEFLDTNHLAWSRTMAPVIMANPDRPELSEELSSSFCRINPAIAKHFARLTFMSDNRADLPKLKIKSLILQCSHDALASESVGQYMHDHLARSEMVVMKATGHCPNLSAPDETTAAIQSFLAASTSDRLATQ